MKPLEIIILGANGNCVDIVAAVALLTRSCRLCYRAL